MKARKQRPHTQGSSNRDYRQNNLKRPQEITQIDFLATAKPRHFDQIIKEKQQKEQPNPLLETQNFYKDLNKSQKPVTQIAYPREAQLEEKTLRKRVFNGESNTIFDPLTKSNKLIRQQTKLNPYLEQERLANYKHEDYSKQIQETQLVNIDRNYESLEGQVDLTKVKEIRRAIRRRYANRKNFQKIFNAWDQDNSGKITIPNAFDMIKKLGIKINLNEARVLVASVDHDRSGNMTMDEFMHLIFNDSDGLDVNLKQIPKVNEHNLHLIHENEQFNEDLNQKAVEQRKNRHQTQLNMILKNKCKNLANLFRLSDELNSGYVTFDKLEEIFQKQNIPRQILSEKDEKWIFDNYKYEDYKFNYKRFVDDLNAFQFHPDQVYQDHSDIQKQKSPIQRVISKFKDNEDHQMYVFDAHKVNPWHLEKIRKDFKNIKRIMKRYLETEKDFQELFNKTYNIESEKQLQEKQISKKDLTNFIQNMFLNVGEKDVKKHQVENFLSVFQYNKHSHTNAAQLAPTIYLQEDEDWYEQVQRNTNPPLPPNSQKFHPDFPVKNQETDEKKQTPKNIENINNNENNHNNENNSENNIKQINENTDSFTTDNIRLNQPPIDNRRTQTAGGSMRRKTNLNNFTVTNPKLQNILQKLENRLFTGSQNSYQIFKNFDQDKDGYVSQKDLIEKIQSFALFSDSEIQQIVNYVDPQNTGQLNFRQFSDKIRDGLLYNDQKGRNTYINSMQPSKEYINSIQEIAPNVNKKIRDLINQRKGDKESLETTWRFKYTPHYKNTFNLIKPQFETPQYQEEKDRFNRSHNHRTEWQKQESRKKYSYEEGRINKIRHYQSQINCKKINQENLVEEKQNSKLKTKGILQWTYEHRAHLQNNWNGPNNKLAEVREERNQNAIRPPLFGKWNKL